MRDWLPTPAWVEAERLVRYGGSCLSCGPRKISEEARAEYVAELESVNALRRYL